ncbi:glycosyltransferase family 4 protein [Staphylococcus equorum]
MKILFSASVYRHLVSFHIPYINYFLNQGYEVFAIAKNDGNKEVLENLGVKCYEIDIERVPYKIKNIKAYKQLKNFLSKHNFDLITTHTPFISFLIRLINHNNTKLIYTAHGFHFYKNGSLIKNIIYKTMEKYAAKYTDELVVMNNEDYNSAKNILQEKNVSLINGIGVDLNKYTAANINKNSNIREEFNFDLNDVIISYIAEMSKRKNQMYLLQNWEKIKLKCPHAKLLLVGNGEMESFYKEYIRINNIQGVYFTGYRRDVKEIIYQSNIVVLLSLHEGLPRCILEGIALHKPVIVSNIRGNSDLVENGYNGFKVDLNKNDQLVDRFTTLINNKELQQKMGLNNEEIKLKYSEETVLNQMKKIYNKVL